MADSSSSVHASNLVETCGQCHESVTPTFAAIEMHAVDQESRNPIAFIVKNFYIWMIVIVIGGMFLHNLLIMIHHVREKKKVKSGQILVSRFQPFEVYQHMLMFLSFSVLVITGFALKFPDAAWVQLLLYIGLDEALRSLLHRIAAVIMIVISIIQMVYFIFSPNGRRDFISMLPNLQDFKDLIINLKFYLGLSKEKPRYGRYDYGEKAEYLALIWGTIVMAASGFVLWFPEFFISFLPTWVFETSEVIHYYEAWLATLAIVIWHWFFVILHPEKYPMSITWMDGKITEDEFKHHHPLEYEKLQQKPNVDPMNTFNKQD
jgi:formate dehydrogenase gamma subunit